MGMGNRSKPERLSCDYLHNTLAGSVFSPLDDFNTNHYRTQLSSRQLRLSIYCINMQTLLPVRLPPVAQSRELCHPLLLPLLGVTQVLQASYCTFYRN